MTMTKPSPPTVVQLPASHPLQVYPRAAPIAPVHTCHTHCANPRFTVWRVEGCNGCPRLAHCRIDCNKDKEPTKVTKHLCPLADEVYMEVLPEKYKHQIFTKFVEVSNPFDHITIFEIKCEMIRTNGKLKLQQFLTSLNGNVLWYSTTVSPGQSVHGNTLLSNSQHISNL